MTRRTSHRACLWVAALAIAGGGLARLTAQAPQPQPRARFDTKAELVLADVTVVDRDSRPVLGLQAADFELQVNGQPRPIQSVQFVSTVPADTAPFQPRSLRPNMQFWR